MRIVNIIILIAVFILGVIEMRKTSSIIKENWFKQLSYDDKIKTTAKIKYNWKVTIFLLAIIVCEMLIVLSSYIGKTHYYESFINILILVISVIVAILLVFNNKKFYKEIKH